MTHYDITGVLRELWDVYSRHIVLYENCEHCTMCISVMTILIIIKPAGFFIELKIPRPYTVHSFISCIRATRSSSVVTLSRPPTSSSLRITNRSFRYASPHLWNQLPVLFRQPCTKHPADDVTHSNSPPTCSPLSPSITHSLFHSRLKTHLFHKSFPP